MAPKTKYDRNMILDAALEAVREGGAEKLSAQEIARRLGGSTMPIYVQFPSMVELRRALDERVLELMKASQARRRSGEAFYDMGLGYIAFAREEPRLFRDLFLPMRVDLSPRGALAQSFLPLMEADASLAGLGEERKLSLFMRMWIFMHGFAALSGNEGFPYAGEAAAAKLIKEVGWAVIKDELERSDADARKRNAE